VVTLQEGTSALPLQLEHSGEKSLPNSNHYDIPRELLSLHQPSVLGPTSSILPGFGSITFNFSCTAAQDENQ